MNIEILNLYSNIAKPDSDLIGKHGQSFLIKMNGENILFDVGGDGDTLLHNMKKLNVDPNEISKLIFSHGHYDHTKGLPEFLDARSGNKKLPVYAHPDVREPKYAKVLFIKKNIGFPKLTNEQEEKIEFKFNRGPIQINDILRTTGEIKERKYRDGAEPTAVHMEGDELKMDPIYDDLSLILELDKEQIIITGCAHAGILNICTNAKKTSDKPIKAIIGGTHMARYSEEEVLETGEVFRTKFNDPNLYLNHCTDQLPYFFMKSTNAIDILREKYGAEKIEPCYVGTKISYSTVS
ncbi:MAG: MBL fold metallo-hydrolase [Promethearchaeota archaeon]|nr:MAG: MBL fold metallo-hydrolase [Candidatus Lokiarchaeota archaeon]